MVKVYLEDHTVHVEAILAVALVPAIDMLLPSQLLPGTPSREYQP